MTREDPVGEAEAAFIAAGDAALKAGDWMAARDAFLEALALGESPEALNGLGQALWWLGETSASIDYRERAYSGFRARPDPDRAVDIALGLSIHYQANVGNAPASSGWLGRARRLVDEFALDSYRGWIALFDAGEAGDPVAVERLSRDALETARGVRDPDLELCALAQIGSALVSQGRVAEGVAFLDEAMAGSLSGESGDFETIVFTSCNMIGSCTSCAEFERAVQWIRAADRFTRRYGCPFLYLYCRVHYGQILIATGDWTEAEAQLTSALKESQGSQEPLHALASAALAELRFAQGRLREAEDLIDPFGGHGPAAAVAASLYLARGKPSLAASTARRALDGADPLGRALLAELLGNAEIALGEHASADARGRELSEQGAAVDCELIRARGERLRGCSIRAREGFDAALSIFARIGMPYEVARTQLMLAETIRRTEPEVAEAEARSALTTFEGLGAGRDADAAAALLRELGVKAARFGPKGRGALTKRETEALALIAEGLSNPEIAERLYLSRKTVEHHVASILPKLGARNRAEAVRIAMGGSLAK
ncbi:MAG: LuxR C-terminal-related transcriptional regulator [Actinomycetota bacterium]|nr:LuxR C-terminal-related transcriptional regulator [Actinomycetota bacterium]